MKPRFHAKDAGVRIVSEVSDRDVLVSFASCWDVPVNKNYVLEGFRGKRLADIRSDTLWNVELSEDIASEKLSGLNAMYNCVSSAYPWLWNE